VAQTDAIKGLTEAIKHNTFVNMAAIRELYRYRQISEADKVPPMWKPYTVLLPGGMSGDPINVFPRNPKRSGFVIQNVPSSGGTVLWSSRPFNIAEVTAVLAGTTQGVIDVGTLVVGGQSSISTSGPLFVATASASAATLQIIETLFYERNVDSTPGNDDAGKTWQPSGKIETFLDDFVKELV
jgi:hypothetical protein